MTRETIRNRTFDPKIPRMTEAEWLAEGRRRFGEDFLVWKFVCPICAHVQAVGDFRRFTADPNCAHQECIGRYLPKDEHREAFGKRTTPSQPCDYAIYGLFSFPGLIVVREDGYEQPVFAFAEAS